MRSHKTRSTRDQSVPRSLERWVSTKTSILQLSFFSFYMYNMPKSHPRSLQQKYLYTKTTRTYMKVYHREHKERRYIFISSKSHEHEAIHWEIYEVDWRVSHLRVYKQTHFVISVV